MSADVCPHVVVAARPRRRPEGCRGIKGGLAVGLKVTATEAARLASRGERTIRQWIATGRLAAEPAGFRERRQGVGPNRWLVDVDDLARIPGVRLDAARLAELEAQAALQETSEAVLGRLARMEQGLEQVRQELSILREHLAALERRQGENSLPE